MSDKKKWFSIIKRIVPVVLTVFFPKAPSVLGTIIIEAIEIAEVEGGKSEEKLNNATNVVKEFEPEIEQEQLKKAISAVVDSTNLIINREK